MKASLKKFVLIVYSIIESLMAIRFVKVKLSLYLIMPLRHMEGGGITQTFLTSALNGGEWSASRSCRLIT
jgi:hypothetical protein